VARPARKLAANLAIDRKAIDQARRPALADHVQHRPDSFDSSAAAGLPFDPPAPRALGRGRYAGASDAGEYFCDMTSADAAEAMIGYLRRGIAPSSAARARRLQQEHRRQK